MTEPLPPTPERTLDEWEGWAGSAAGQDCIALGNGLAGSEVAQSMVDTFQASTAVPG